MKGIIFVLTIITFGAADIIHTNEIEQYGGLLRKEDYIDPLTGLHITDASLFIGIFHIAVDQHTNGDFYMQLTLYHQIEFCDNIYITGPALYGTATSNPPLLTIAFGNVFASSPNSPIQIYEQISATFLWQLRTGLLSVVISSTGQPSGKVQGWIQPRTDLLMTFFSNQTLSTVFEATDGMALISIEKNSHQPANVNIRYWLLTKYHAGTFVLFDTQGSQLGPLGDVPQTALVVNAVIFDPSNLGSIPETAAIVCPGNITSLKPPFPTPVQPLTPHATTNLELRILVDGIFFHISYFVRVISYYNSTG